MNASLHPGRLLDAAQAMQVGPPRVKPGVLRIVWKGRYGEVLIEILDGRVRVDGDWVEPATPNAEGGPASGSGSRRPVDTGR